MRPALIGIAAAVGVTATIGVTATVQRRADKGESIQQPVVSFEQAPTTVTVRVHNRNKHWGLRNQKVSIVFRHANGLPIRTYGPSGVFTHDGKAGPSISCCEIAHLAPGGDHEFILFPPYPNTFTIKVVTMHLDGGPGWIRM